MTRSPELALPRPAGRAARLALLALLPWLTHCATAPRLDGIEPSYAIPPGDAGQLDAKVRRDLGAEPDGFRRQARRAERDGVRLPRRDGRRGRAHARRAVLHLARRLHRPAARGRTDASRGARRAGAGADRRHRRAREARTLRRRRPAPESRGARLQPVLQPLRIARQSQRNASCAAAGSITACTTRPGSPTTGSRSWAAATSATSTSARPSTRTSATWTCCWPGPIVAEVSASFDEYWNSPNAVPVARFDGKAPPPARPREADRRCARVPRRGGGYALHPGAARRAQARRAAAAAGADAAGRRPCACWSTTRRRSAPRSRACGPPTCSRASPAQPLRPARNCSSSRRTSCPASGARPASSSRWTAACESSC